MKYKLKTPHQEVGNNKKKWLLKKKVSSFVESKEPAEEHDYKKRYDDLKKHYDAKLSEFKSEREQLASEIKAIKANMQSLPQGTVPPKSPEELQKFKEKYPDVYEVVETVASGLKS